MAVVGNLNVSKDLDQVMTYYCQQLKKLSTYWSQMTQLGVCDVTMSKSAEDMMDRLEQAVAAIMEKEIRVEKAKQSVLDLKAILDISRQTVEAKSKHLGQEEKQKEEAQSLKFKEYQRIHKLQDEKALFEKEIVPAKRKLSKLKDLLDEKNEKMRNLENFHEILADHCALDMILLKDMTDETRAERHKWDAPDLDVSKEMNAFLLNMDELHALEETVGDFKDVLQNQKIWYDEELQTKLFYSTRSKEIKHKINYFKNVLRRLEKTGRSEDTDEDHDEKRLSRRSEHILVDGSPGVEAKEVELYLSHQFGMKVLADYTMLRRLKDEIGVQGLAYLVEKIRLQGCSCAQTPSPSQSYTDWEEKRIEKALKSIALEYRDHDENKRLLRVPGLSQDSCVEEQQHAPSDHTYPSSPSLSNSSYLTRNTSNTEVSSPSNQASRKSSSNSLKRKNSLARIKKFLKF
ncbi:uncharacterized protein LOC131939546 [Physella acuta]|uniref:uncharacterized protein LOC131939546 n=1 Tax=Physella acuta TaxID=109671 RepID=UPI0027DD3828|nr:uncharacterized protein LOC131939546 [Physella acuta]